MGRTRLIPSVFPNTTTTLLRFKCKVSIVISSISIPTTLPLSIIVFVYKEYQARGLIHIHFVHLQPDGTTVQSAFDPFGISADIRIVRNRVMHSRLYRVVTHLPEIQPRYRY